MYEIRLRPEAERDIEDASAWYENQREGLGDQFLDEILHSLDAIAEHPSMFPVVYKGIQRALIHRFPFGIYYRTLKQTVVVLSIMHGSRNPRQWKQRMR